MRRLVLLDVLQGAGHAVAPLARADGLLHPLREVVDHRVPDRAGVLQEVPVQLAELLDRAGLDRPRVVLVVDAHAAVVDGQARVADRSVRRRDERVDQHPQAVDLHDLVVAGLHEVLEAQVLQRVAQVRDREVGQQDRGVLVHVAGEPVGVEVVSVQMRDVRGSRRADPRRVERRCCPGTAPMSRSRQA